MSNSFLFFALEGLDGSGKTTQLQLLAQHIQTKRPNLPIHTTLEPTASPMGSYLRDILSKKREGDPPLVSTLFASDRLHHILHPEQGLLSHLQQGSLVLCDRYYFSSYAYNSVDQPLDSIIEQNKQNALLLSPTATLFIDVPPELTMERVQKSRSETQLYETLQYQQKVYQNYQDAFLRLQDKETVLRIDGNQPQEDVTLALWEAILPYLPPV